MIRYITTLGLAVTGFHSLAHADIVENFDQRYEGANYNNGVWLDSVSSNQNATAVNESNFTIVNTPNGAQAVANTGSLDSAVMNFTRNSSLNGAGFTIQAVIRLDDDGSSSTTDGGYRQGPFAIAESGGFSGIFMGAYANNTSSLRSGNVNGSSPNSMLNGTATNTLSVGTWGIYTLVTETGENPQMTASFVRLDDLSNAFTITDTTNQTGNIISLSTSGRLFGGEMGGALSATDNWVGAIADIIVYDSALDTSDINANLIELQNLYYNQTSISSKLRSGLLSYWAFEDNLDDSAHNNASTDSQSNDVGSWVGNAAYNIGRLGKGLTLTGTQHVQIPNSFDLDRSGSDLTISAWIKVDTWDTDWQALLAKGEANNYRIARNGNNNERLSYAGGQNDVSGGSVNDGDWHHIVAITKDGISSELWIDGALVNLNAGNPTISNNASLPLLIGANPESTTLRRWKGSIDEVALWDRALSSAEITFLAAGNPLLVDPFLFAESPIQLAGTPFNGGSVQRSIPISNIGSNETLNISNVSIGGQDSTNFTIDSFPSSIAPGQEANILVTFTPIAIESYEATLTVTSNSENSSSTTIDINIDALPDLISGITFRVYQADRTLDSMPLLGNDQTPNIDEIRNTINYQDNDKNGVADPGSDGHFGAIPPLDRLENIYAQAKGYLQITTPGAYSFRLTADDGAELYLNNDLVIQNTDAERSSETSLESGSLDLNSGIMSFLITFWNGSGSPYLQLEWMTPGSTQWELVPTFVSGVSENGFVTENATPVVSEGDKLVFYPGQPTGQLDQIHPGYNLFTFTGDYDTAYPGEGRPNPASLTIDGTTQTFRPQVGAMDFLPDGRLLVASFQPPGHGSNVPADNTLDHKIYSVSGATGSDLSSVVIKEVANGLSRPAGMCVVGSDVYVAEIHKIIRLRDNNSDGDFLDDGEETEILNASQGWSTDNYHQFTFGLIHENGKLYGTLSTSIVFGGGTQQGLNGPNPANRGTWFEIDISTGDITFLAGGLRTPNGIGFGPEGKQFGTDNQGSWNPSNSLYELTEDHFYGHYTWPTGEQSAFWDSSVYWDTSETPQYASLYEGNKRRFTRPTIYLPQGDLSQSPTQPLMIGDQHPTFKGQMYIAELTMGGIRRAFLEKINGRFQGAAFRFTQGMVAGNNRMVWGPDNALYVGGMGPGDSSNWSWRGTWYGLQRLSPNGIDAFEMQTVRAVDDGFIITFTKPVDSNILNDLSNYEPIEHWTYDSQSYVYGAGQTNLPDLTVSSAEALLDGRSVHLTIPNLQEETVVHIQLSQDLTSSSGETLWTGETFYTLNAKPSEFESAWAFWVTEHYPGVADLDIIGPTADPDGDNNNQNANLYTRTFWPPCFIS